MENLKATYYIDGKKIDNLKTSDKSEIRRFYCDILPPKFNCVAHCGWMLAEIREAPVKTVKREWREGRSIHKLTLEAI